jgi:hypothetical protein
VRRFAIHGLALELHCHLPEVMAEVLGMFHPFEVPSWPEGFTPIVGTVEPFDADTVARHVSPAAVRFPSLHHSI